MRSDRLFELIQLLRRAKRPLTAKHLSDSLEVTERTIYRDVAALQAMGIPVVGEAGVGYVMRKGYDLPPLMFDAVEVEAIAVGLALLQRTGDRGLMSAAGRVAGKLADVVPRAYAGELDGETFHVSKFGAPKLDLSVYRSALKKGLRIFITYSDAGTTVTSRTILPIALHYYVEVVLLVAWCDLRMDFRHFRVDRVSEVRVLEGIHKQEAKILRGRWMELHSGTPRNELT